MDKHTYMVFTFIPAFRPITHNKIDSNLTILQLAETYHAPQIDRSLQDTKLIDLPLPQYYHQISISTIWGEQIDPEVANIIKFCGYTSNSIDKFYVNCYRYLFHFGMSHLITKLVDGTNTNEQLAICVAAINYDDFDVIAMLIQKGFDINQYVVDADNGVKSNILYASIAVSNLTMIKFLVDNGAKIDTNALGSLYICNSEIFEYLVQSNSITTILDYTLLVFLMTVELDDYMLSNYIYEQTEKDKIIEQTIRKFELLFSTSDQHIDISKLANYFECDPEQNNEANNEATNSSCYRKINLKLLQFLLNNGLVLSNGILSYAIMHNAKIEIIDFLLNYGLIPNISAIEHAFVYNNIQIISLFIKHRIDISLLPKISEFDNFVNDIESIGLDKLTLINYLLTNKRTEFNLINDFNFDPDKFRAINHDNNGCYRQ